MQPKIQQQLKSSSRRKQMQQLVLPLEAAAVV
jgi:hypothetical protein